MALIKCNECGKEISNKASSCPNCGNPIFEEKVKKMKKKKWEDLTLEEKNRIIAYRKSNKEWWIVSRIYGLIFLTIGVLVAFIGLIILNPNVIWFGDLIMFLSLLFVKPEKNEQKTWYENNVERLYREKILK